MHILKPRRKRCNVIDTYSRHSAFGYITTAIRTSDVELIDYDWIPFSRAPRSREDRLEMYLCSPGDDVQIFYTERAAEVTSVYLSGRFFSDSNRNLQPMCFECRHELIVDSSDIRCSNVNCKGTEKGRLSRALELYARYRYGAQTFDDATEEYDSLVSSGVRSIEKLLSPLAADMTSLFPITSDLAERLRYVQNGFFRDKETECIDLLAVLIDMFAIPGLSALDCYHIARDISDEDDLSAFSFMEIWRVLSRVDVLMDTIDISEKYARDIVKHVHARRNRHGDLVIRGILNRLSNR